MEPIAKRIRFTYEDYIHMPEDKRYELIGGGFIMVPSPSTLHQRVLLRLSIALYDFVVKNDLGSVFTSPYDVVLSEEDVLQPDIVVVAKENEGIITDKNIRGAPDLIVEVLSPSTEYRDRVIKRKLYARSGVKEYWVVDPEGKSVEVFQFKEGGFDVSMVFTIEEDLKGFLFKGLKIPLKGIFEEG